MSDPATMSGPQLALLLDVAIPATSRIAGLFIAQHPNGWTEVRFEELAALFVPTPSRNTLRRILQPLLVNGWIERRPGGRSRADRYVFHDAHRGPTVDTPIQLALVEADGHRGPTNDTPKCADADAPEPDRGPTDDTPKRSGEDATMDYIGVPPATPLNGNGEHRGPTDDTPIPPKTDRWFPTFPHRGPTDDTPKLAAAAAEPRAREEEPTATPVLQDLTATPPFQTAINPQSETAPDRGFFFASDGQNPVKADAILAHWLDLTGLSRQLSPADRGKQAAAAKRLATRYDAPRLAAAFIGIGLLFKFSRGEPWDLLDLEREFPKALLAFSRQPEALRQQRRREIRERLRP